MRVAYRVRQFVRALAGPRTAPQLGDFVVLLTPEQTALFAGMAVTDQRHCLAVAATLVAGGHGEADLLRAALVHDAGKALARIRLWQRVLYVLLNWLAPGLVHRLGSASARGSLYGLYVLAHHAELAAGLVAQAGFSEAVAALVRGEGDARLQAALHSADELN